MIIEKISSENIYALTHLILELWKDCSFDEELNNCKRILHTESETCFLVKQENQYIAFIYLSLRTDHVEGATTSPVAYIEGIFVKEAYQRLGIARKLVATGESWGREKGCREIASDAEVNNQISIEFHKKTGFREVNQIVCFVKEVNQTK